MSTVRDVIGETTAPRVGHEGFDVAGLRSPQPWMDPYLTIDHFVMSQPEFRAHAHAGFSAVTLMFEDSPGSISNRDSTGTHVMIHPGDLHWTQAGSGVVHEEVPSEPPTPCHGAQIFIDLPATVEETPPRFFHLDSADVPTITTDGGGRVRVLVGEVDGVRSPVEPDTDTTMLDVILPPRATVVIPMSGRTAFAFAIAGSGEAGPEGREHALALDHALGFGDDDGVRLVAGADGLHAVVGGGDAVGQPIHWIGGLAMSTRERVETAASRLKAGEFGELEPSF